jgi:hypothetical protein
MTEKITLTKEVIANNIYKEFKFSFEKNNYQNVVTQIVDKLFAIHHMGNIHFNRTLLDFYTNF